MTRAQHGLHHRIAKSPLLLVIALAALGVFIGACSAGAAERLWLPAPGWSRAMTVGRSATGGQIAMLVESERVLAFLASSGDERTAALVTFPLQDPTGLQAYALPALAGRTIRQPNLVRAGQEYRLYWIEDGAVHWSAWHEDPGEASQPRSVNITGGISEYAVAVGPSGQVWLWMAGGEDHQGLYVISPDRPSPQDPVLDPLGRRPALASADDGLHAVWVRPPEGSGQASIIYSRLAWNSSTPSEPVEIAARTLSNTDVHSGPWIGAQGGYAYVFFTVEVKSGLRAGETDTSAHVFPVADPTAVSRLGNRIHLQPPPGIGSADPADVLAGAPGLDPWEPAVEVGSAALTQIAPDPNARARLAVALKAELTHLRSQRQSQVAVLYFEGGSPLGSEVVTFTPAPSTRPVIQSGRDGALHLMWLERAEQEGQVVYYSSTDPRVVTSLQGMTSDDLARLTADTLFAMLSGMLFFPLALLWLILPVVVILASSFLRREGESLMRRGTLISMTAAVAIYWFVKLLVIPGLFATTPFSAWHPVIPTWLAIGLRFIIPVSVSALGLLAAWQFTYRRGRHSPLFFILLFGLFDGALSMAIYAESLIGGF